jgi:hypothetical protein
MQVLEPSGTGFWDVRDGNANTFDIRAFGNANAVGICNCAPKMTRATTAAMDRTSSEVRMDFTFPFPLAANANSAHASR